jgi:iron(III) transport system ATP-binding protein
MAMAEITVDRVSKRFGPVQVLSDLDLCVPDGSTLALVGPSGCGKTTLLRLIAGFDQPDAGTIAIDGQVVSGDPWVPAHRRSVAYLPQDGALFPHLTVGENVAFGIGRENDRDARVSELLELVSLDPALSRRRPDQLSGGQQQRVALARALAVRPRALLLDEPFSALDADLRIGTRKAVRVLLNDLKMTTIFVTHDREDARHFADQVAVMDQGRLGAIGPPA